MKKIIEIPWIISIVIMVLSNINFVIEKKFEILILNLIIITMSILSYIVYLSKDRLVFKTFSIMSVLSGVLIFFSNFWEENKELGMFGDIVIALVILLIILVIVEAILYKTKYIK